MRWPRRHAFTLVELLAVVAIVAVLLALLMPALAAARRQVGDVHCASNERQLCVALLAYATANKGRFPSNELTDQRNATWLRDEVLGAHTSGERVYAEGEGLWARAFLGGVFACPRDEDSCLSYAMNFNASGRTDPGFTRYVSGPFRGPRVPHSSKMILVVENLSVYPSPYGRMAYPIAGGLSATTPVDPGRWFGGGEGIPHTWGHAPPCLYASTTTSSLSYMNHRRPSDGGTGPEARGRLNVGYCDGHVEMKRDTDLYDRATGGSRFDSLWSPDDFGLSLH